jgi:hypothetical protein
VFSLFLQFKVSDSDVIQCSRRPLSTPEKMEAPSFVLASPWNEGKDGNACAVDILPGIIAVGTDKGGVQVFTYGGGRHTLHPYLAIPPPPVPGMSVVTCKLSVGKEKASVFVAYRRTATASSPRSTAGVCCYDMPLPGANPTQLSAPSARHDLDGRHVPSSGLSDAVPTKDGNLFTVVSKVNSTDRSFVKRSIISQMSAIVIGSSRWSLHLLDHAKG